MAGLYEGKVALVTGASGGIGEGIARELAREGAAVVLVARRRQLLEALATELAGPDGRAIAVTADVTVEADIRAIIGAAKARFGQLHLLVNNAGRELVAPLAVTKPEAARNMLEVNVLATAMVTRACLPLLKKGSAVVNIASVRGLKGEAAVSLYAASKGAIIALTRSLARELAPRGVRVNAVAPGMVRSEMFDRITRPMTPEQVAAMEAAHPLGFGTVEDVARAVAFLGGDNARWITGQTLAVDGGLTA